MGFFNNLKKKIKKAVKKVVTKVKNTVKKAVRVAKELFYRGLGVLEFIFSVFGLRPIKHLRLKVVILIDNGAPVKSEAEVNRWVDRMKEIYKDEANIKIHPGFGNKGENIVEVMEDIPVPEIVLDHPKASIATAFDGRSDWFDEYIEEHLEPRLHLSLISNFMGRGDLIYVFITRDIESQDGFAYPGIHDFCVVEADPKTTTMAHEVTHQCGVLLHSNEENNLMNVDRDDLDGNLGLVQISIIRTSRYVFY